MPASKQHAPAKSANNVVERDYGVTIGNERRRDQGFNLRPRDELYLMVQWISFADTAQRFGDEIQTSGSATA